MDALTNIYLRPHLIGVSVFFACEGLQPPLSSLIGIIDNPSLALFAGRCFPKAFSDGHCVTLCFTHRTRHWI
jgi:hypothetical protein